MYLTQLIYCSRPLGLDKEQVSAILAESRVHNDRHGISGILLFNGSIFLQCLEGQRVAVNATYQRILQDERHEKPMLLSYREVSERQFADWNMGYVSWQQSMRSVIKTFSVAEDLDPYSMSADSVRGLLLALLDKVHLADDGF